MEVKNEKKVLVLSFLGVLTFIAVVVGATYAYFTAQGGGTGNINVNANTATTDNLSFQTGSAISLTANQEDFGQGSGNKSGETFARATLTANNATNNATRNYYIYLDITSNNFEYTTDDEQAELLLKITDPDGTEVTTLGSLKRKTSGGETGFDITESTGLITIADNYEITSTGTITQEWQIEVIFANLDSDQNANTNKTFIANLIIQEEAYEYTLADVCPDGGNLASCIQTYYTTYSEGIGGLYFHDGIGSYTNADQEAVDNSYRYSGANPNNYVCFGSDEATCPVDNLYRIIGVFNGQVKLIKADFAGESVLGTAPAFSRSPFSYYKGSLSSIPYYYWSGSSSNESNIWSSSTLNTSVLNGTYLTTLGSEWSELIAITNWQVGGNSWENIGTTTVKNAYTNEIVSPAESTTYEAKIGLMYVSDYYYGATPTYWSYLGFSSSSYPNTDGNYGEEYDYRAATNNNWMHMGADEWTISRNSDNSTNAFLIYYTGGTSHDFVYYGYTAVRPSFYLESSVEISGGDGTEQNPFRIVV